MWNLPEPGVEPMSPALAGRFLTTGPPGKSLHFLVEGEVFEDELIVGVMHSRYKE